MLLNMFYKRNTCFTDRTSDPIKIPFFTELNNVFRNNSTTCVTCHYVVNIETLGQSPLEQILMDVLCEYMSCLRACNPIKEKRQIPTSLIDVAQIHSTDTTTQDCSIGHSILPQI